MKQSKVLFSLEKQHKAFTDATTIQSFMGFVNSLLNNYSLKVTSFRKMMNKQRAFYYKLEVLHDAQYIVKAKIEKDKKVFDKDNLLADININESTLLSPLLNP